jgi:hypothetical protein
VAIRLYGVAAERNRAMLAGVGAAFMGRGDVYSALMQHALAAADYGEAIRVIRVRAEVDPEEQANLLRHTANARRYHALHQDAAALADSAKRSIFIRATFRHARIVPQSERLGRYAEAIMISTRPSRSSRGFGSPGATWCHRAARGNTDRALVDPTPRSPSRASGFAFERRCHVHAAAARPRRDWAIARTLRYAGVRALATRGYLAAAALPGHARPDAAIARPDDALAWFFRAAARAARGDGAGAAADLAAARRRVRGRRARQRRTSRPPTCPSHGR